MEKRIIATFSSEIMVSGDKCGKHCKFRKDVYEERSGPDYQYCTKYKVSLGDIAKIVNRSSKCIKEFGK